LLSLPVWSHRSNAAGAARPRRPRPHPEYYCAGSAPGDDSGRVVSPEAKLVQGNDPAREWLGWSSLCATG